MRYLCTTCALPMCYLCSICCFRASRTCPVSDPLCQSGTQCFGESIRYTKADPSSVLLTCGVGTVNRSLDEELWREFTGLRNGRAVVASWYPISVSSNMILRFMKDVKSPMEIRDIRVSKPNFRRVLTLIVCICVPLVLLCLKTLKHRRNSSGFDRK